MLLTASVAGFVAGCGPAPTEAFKPDLSRPWSSTWGDIHWGEGFYEIPNKTIEIARQHWDGMEGVYIVEGRWGRQEGDEQGGYRFVFRSACRFEGRWWYSSSPASRQPWKGKLEGCD